MQIDLVKQHAFYPNGFSRVLPFCNDFRQSSAHSENRRAQTDDFRGGVLLAWD